VVLKEKEYIYKLGHIYDYGLSFINFKNSTIVEGTTKPRIERPDIKNYSEFWEAIHLNRSLKLRKEYGIENLKFIDTDLIPDLISIPFIINSKGSLYVSDKLRDGLVNNYGDLFLFERV
jgi:hypothetical protein